jgi:hypothetical protein
MERIYDSYELEEEKAAWFLKWENEIAAIARRAGVAQALDVPRASLIRVGKGFAVARRASVATRSTD